MSPVGALLSFRPRVIRLPTKLETSDESRAMSAPVSEPKPMVFPAVAFWIVILDEVNDDFKASPSALKMMLPLDRTGPFTDRELAPSTVRLFSATA